MKNSRSKTATLIALFLVLTVAATLVALPFANARTPPLTLPTWCFIAASRNPIGVNQELIITFWLHDPPPTAQGAYGDRWTFWIDITKPDSSKETLGPLKSDPVGGGYIIFTPTQVGTYTIVARMDSHVVTGQPLNPSGGQTLTAVNDTYLASASDPMELIVQEQPIQPWPEAPLPTQFWTRPINSANRDWVPLAANWLAGAAQNVGPTVNFGYGTGPESAHVMWATPMWAGGIMDARFGVLSYQSVHYSGLGLAPPIILNGKIYYNDGVPPIQGWHCVDLYTGKEDYFYNNSGPSTATMSSSGSIPYGSLAFGQILYYDCPNLHGGYPYLWSTSGPGNTWMMFDAYSGNYICSIANVSGGTAAYGKDGSILRYSISGTGANRRLLCWNTTQAIWWRPVFTGNSYWGWNPGLNITYDGRNGYSLNASIPNVQGSILTVREDQYVIGGTAGQNDENGTIMGNLWALNLKPDNNGIITPTLLWNITFTPPRRGAVPGVGVNSMRAMKLEWVDPEDGVFVFSEQLTRHYWGFDLSTGQLLWGPTAPESQMQYYGWSSADCNGVYQGKFFSSGYGGQVYAYNITTGEVLWIYNATNVGFESPYGNYPVGTAGYCDGKIYLCSSEHTATQPLWRGSYLRCINATDGTEIWKVLHWGGERMAGMWGVYFADGFLVSLNHYDNQIYCYGKGPSSTTVTASPKVAVHGNSVMIEGTVTDQSPGAKDTPAIADESVEAWMEYLYAKQAMPTNATGVPVTLDTIDPNGNFVHIGTATSDMSGMFKKAFVPEVPGEYTIIATFAGSKSYYSSYAETAINVDEAPPATAAPEYPQPIDPTMTIIGAAIAIIIAVAVATLLILRKK